MFSIGLFCAQFLLLLCTVGICLLGLESLGCSHPAEQPAGILHGHSTLSGTPQDHRSPQCRLESVTSSITLLTYSMAQQPLKSFDRPLMKVSLSDSILVILIFY